MNSASRFFPKTRQRWPIARLKKFVSFSIKIKRYFATYRRFKNTVEAENTRSRWKIISSHMASFWEAWKFIRFHFMLLGKNGFKCEISSMKYKPDFTMPFPIWVSNNFSVGSIKTLEEISLHKYKFLSQENP